MSNQVQVAQAPALPAFLQRLSQNTALASIGAAAVSGISSGGHHRIGIGTSRWRLNDVQGNENVVPHLHLDVIIVDANPAPSKIYYTSKYNPKETEATAPTCFSDNGVAPSDRAVAPQNNICATCPHNVWGSGNAGKGRACSDSKRLAVILADNPTGPVYELKIPAASMSNLANAINQLNQFDMAVPTLVFRLTFDSAAEFPKIMFEPVGYINEIQAAAVENLIDKVEVKKITGRDDIPLQDLSRVVRYLPATTAEAPTPVATSFLPQATPAPVFVAPVAQAPQPAPAPAYVAPVVQAAPAPAAPTGFFAKMQAGQEAPAPVHTVVDPGHTYAAQPTTETPAKKRKGKAAAAAPIAPGAYTPPAAPIPPQVYGPMPAAAPVAAPAAFFAGRPDLPNAASPAASVVTNPVVTDSSLDGLLGDALS